MDKDDSFDLIADEKKRANVKKAMNDAETYIGLSATVGKLIGEDPEEVEYDERMSFIIGILKAEKEKIYCGRKVGEYSEFHHIAERFSLIFKELFSKISEKDKLAQVKLFTAFKEILLEYMQKGVLTDNFSEPFAQPSNVSSILSKDALLKKYADLFEFINSSLEKLEIKDRYKFIESIGINPTISNSIRHADYTPKEDCVIFLNEDKKEYLRLNNEKYLEQIVKRIYFVYAGIAEALSITFGDQNIRKEILNLKGKKRTDDTLKKLEQEK